jgi:hypothetical protein
LDYFFVLGVLDLGSGRSNLKEDLFEPFLRATMSPLFKMQALPFSHTLASPVT